MAPSGAFFMERKTTEALSYIKTLVFLCVLSASVVIIWHFNCIIRICYTLL